MQVWHGQSRAGSWRNHNSIRLPIFFRNRGGLPASDQSILKVIIVIDPRLIGPATWSPSYSNSNFNACKNIAQVINTNQVPAVKEKGSLGLQRPRDRTGSLGSGCHNN
jgi:hypothetical protein